MSVRAPGCYEYEDKEAIITIGDYLIVQTSIRQTGKDGIVITPQAYDKSQSALHYKTMNDTEDCERSHTLELPLITAESLPPLPRLYNPDPSLGPISKYRVFGFTFRRLALQKWADDHQIGLDAGAVQRRALTWRAICRRLPRECRQMALVSTRTGGGGGSGDDQDGAADFACACTSKVVYSPAHLISILVSLPARHCLFYLCPL
ncbi:hypothetical protein LshimejAT787_2300430 [Lyophyllum shimeji]|uniref:Uncharacterized protein n=1 Tax=Lyophyllum shimeji TaxID=47721 RepID=A0A9P3Q1N7_LYOSH|nr:hypothetical protein LshimejAT787_2300430 [Lyophyllum shimeji]